MQHHENPAEKNEKYDTNVEIRDADNHNHRQSQKGGIAHARTKKE